MVSSFVNEMMGDMMKWLIGLFIIGAILSCVKGIFKKIAGIALILGVGFALIGWIVDVEMLFTLTNICCSVVIIIVIGSIINAIFSD